MNQDYYENPLIGRYSSGPMKYVFSEVEKVKTMREVWIALAKSQRDLGLDISIEQIDEMIRHKDNVNLSKIDEFEKITKHDVMANILAFSELAINAKPIIHLGATSCDITDNADIILFKKAISILRARIVQLMQQLSDFSLEFKDLPTLGYTHFQAAQLTTVGKRATLWLHDVLRDLNYLDSLDQNLTLKGLKGATGTQASFLHLFNYDPNKVLHLEQQFAKHLGFSAVEPISSQTYSRKIDYEVLSVLSQIAQSAYKFSNDLRLLQHLKEIEEPFDDGQVGSSAMPYKRNPMRCERISSIARYVLSLPINAAMTSSTQWFERTLDDSANRRIVIPNAFLAVDAILNIYINVTKKLVVYPNVIAKHIMEELPFMMSENILMEAVRRGKDRQSVHHLLKEKSQLVAMKMKHDGSNNSLIDELRSDPQFAFLIDYLDLVVDPKQYIGLAPMQVSAFIEQCILPVLKKYKDIEHITSHIDK
jgi:adenylosuccinate lyase